MPSDGDTSSTSIMAKSVGAASAVTRSSQRFDETFVSGFRDADALSEYLTKAADDLSSTEGRMLQQQTMFSRSWLVEAMNSDTIGGDFNALLDDNEKELGSAAQIKAVRGRISRALRTTKGLNRPITFREFVPWNTKSLY